MFHSYRINSSLLVANGLTRDVEIESYIGGKKKRVVTRANADTFCLYDFLIFFNNAKNRRVIKQDVYEYTWIDYQYLIKANPLLMLNNTKIKRHLEILKALNLIDIINDRGSIYFTIINTELIMINNQPVMNHNREPVMNHNRDNNKYIYNNNNKKEKNNIKKEKENFEAFEVVEVNEVVNTTNDYQIIKAENENKEIEKEFDLFYSLYPRKTAKITAKNAFKQLRLGKHKNYKGIKISLENILLKLSDLINEITLNGIDPNFIPYPASWLNANDFLDKKDDENITSPQNNQNCINEIKELLKNLANTMNDEFKRNPAFKESREYPAFKKQLLFTCIFKIKEICNKHKCSYYKYYGFHEIELPKHELKYKWYLTKSFSDWLKEALNNNNNNNTIEDNTKQIKS